MALAVNINELIYGRAENRRIVARDYRNRRVGDFLKELHLTEGRGTGIPTMYKKMKDNGSPEPVFKTDEECTYFLSVLPINPKFLSDQISAQESAQVSDQVNAQESNQESNQESTQESNQERDQVSNQERAQENAQVSDQVSDQVNDQVSNQVSAQESNQERDQDNDQVSAQESKQEKKELKILEFCLQAKSRTEILEHLLGITNQFKNYKNHIEPLIERNWLQLMFPEKPKHRKQKYFTTPQGKEKLENATR